MDDLAKRVESNFQLTTDGSKPYVEAVEWAFGSEISYAQLIKLFAEHEPQRERSSPSHCIGAVPVESSGTRDPAMICTSHVERNNLTLRTFIRRRTRLSLGFSKKLDNLKHAVALHFAYCNFCRVHRSLRVTSAMQAGITDHVWSFGELILEQRKDRTVTWTI